MTDHCKAVITVMKRKLKCEAVLIKFLTLNFE